MKLFKIFSLFLIIFIFLALPLFFVFALELEIEYPQVGERPVAPAELKELPQYIRYLFTFAIVIAGLVAFTALVYGGFRYLTSVGSPTAMADAKSQIIAGFLGLAILLASFLILQTINPQLTVLKITPVSARMGIILCKASDCSPDILKDPNARSGEDYLVVKSNRSCLEPCEQNESGFSVGSIYFYESSDEVIVELYARKQWQPEPPAWSSIDKDISAFTSYRFGTNIVARSIKLIWKTPGVYLFSTPDCGEKGDPTTKVHYFGPPGRQTFADIGLNDSAKSMKIIPRVETSCIAGPSASAPCNASTPEEINAACGQAQCRKTKVVEKFGAILFEDEAYKHSATVWLGGEPDDLKPKCIRFDEPENMRCYIDREPYCIENISKEASSIYIFRQAVKKPTNPADWGDGVTVFEHVEMNEQEIEKFLDEGKGSAKYCGPINIDSPKAGGGIKPIFVDGNWTARNIGGSHPNYNYGTELNCNELFARWNGSYDATWGTPNLEGDGEKISSIKVAGNYLGLLLKKDGRGEVFSFPGNFNLKISHIGHDDADYLLVIPIQP